MSNDNIVNSNTQAAEENNNSMLWEDLDADKVRSEFKKLSAALDALRNETEKLAKDKTNFDKTKAALEELRDRGLSPSGWISSFVAENATAFPGLNGDGSKRASRPDWYFVLTPEKRKKYDDIFDYMDDAVKLKSFFKPFADILTKLPLADTFRVFAIIKNMETKGWTDEEYQKINDDVESVCNLLKLSWGELDREAVLSERYYKENISVMDTPKAKEGYIKQRQEDYLAIIKKYTIFKSLNYRGNGSYSVLADRIACMKVLDTYMGRLVKNKDLGDRLNSLMPNAENLANSLMSNIVLHTGAGKDLHQAMVNLIVVLRFYITCSLEEFNKFKQGSDEAPYCYMQAPEKTSLAQGWFGFNPKWSDSWSNGTYYKEIYRQALSAITQQCHDFAYLHGKVQ